MATKRKGDALSSPCSKRSKTEAPTATEPADTDPHSVCDFLPDEVLLPILYDFLPPAYTFVASQVCKRWRYIIPNRIEHLAYHGNGASFKKKFVKDGNFHLIASLCGVPDYKVHRVLSPALCKVAAKAGLYSMLLRSRKKEQRKPLILPSSALVSVLRTEKETPICLDAIESTHYDESDIADHFPALLKWAVGRGADAKKVLLALLEWGGDSARRHLCDSSLLVVSLRNRDKMQPFAESLFVWLCSTGVACTSTTITFAAEKGDVEALEWMKEHLWLRQEHTNSVLIGALISGSRNVLDWLLSLGWANLQTVAVLGWYTHHCLVEWFIDKGAWSYDLACLCIDAWDIEALKRVMVQIDPKVKSRDILSHLILVATNKPDLKEVFEWVANLGFTFHDREKESSLGHLISCGRTDMLSCVAEMVAEATPDLFHRIKRSHTESHALGVCRFLIDTIGFRPRFQDVYSVAHQGQIAAAHFMATHTNEPVEWMRIAKSLVEEDDACSLRQIDESYPLDKSRLIKRSLCYGAMEVTKWLCACGVPLPDDALVLLSDGAKKAAPIGLLKFAFDRCVGRCCAWNGDSWLTTAESQCTTIASFDYLLIWVLRRGYPVCAHVLQSGCCPHRDGKCDSKVVVE